MLCVPEDTTGLVPPLGELRKGLVGSWQRDHHEKAV